MDFALNVLAADDVPGVNDAGVKHDEPLFPSEVMYAGHPVCWVLADSLEAARLGALAVEAYYEPLPSLVTVADAIDLITSSTTRRRRYLSRDTGWSSVRARFPSLKRYYAPY